MNLLELTSQEEASLIAYIVFYDQMDLSVFRDKIADIIEEKGKNLTGIVYRGHSKKDDSIQLTTSFISTTPTKKMAELFVETDWSIDEGTLIGNLFKIYLVNMKTLNTREVNYTFSPDVLQDLKQLVGTKMILKKDKMYTFEEYIPFIQKNLQNLVSQGDEILVLNNGQFYKDSSFSVKGFKEIHAPGDDAFYETWYANTCKTQEIS
jgi:hypothetical protein